MTGFAASVRLRSAAFGIRELFCRKIFRTDFPVSARIPLKQKNGVYRM